MEEAVQSETPQIVAEEAVQAPEIHPETAPEVASPTIKPPGVRELRLMARDRGIKGFARMNKEQLLAKLA